MCNQQSLRSACAYAQSDQSLCSSHEYSMSVKLLTEDNFESLNSKGGCACSYESTLVKMPHCWKSHATTQLFNCITLEKLITDNVDGAKYISVCQDATFVHKVFYLIPLFHTEHKSPRID